MNEQSNNHKEGFEPERSGGSKPSLTRSDFGGQLVEEDLKLTAYPKQALSQHRADVKIRAGENRLASDSEEPLLRPDPEVLAIPKRRRFSKEHKLRILKELDACKMPGGRGLIIRREGLFSSQISQWRNSMGTSKKKTKSAQKNKNTDLKNELARLKRKVARLEATIVKKDYLLEAQKKMREILDQLAKTPTETHAE